MWYTYFKQAPITGLDDLLSDHNGILSKTVPPSVIKLANDEVSNAVDDKGNKSMQLLQKLK